MKRKKLIPLLSLTVVNILHLGSLGLVKEAYAATNDYVDNVYQMCNYQKNTHNLFLGNSIFNLDRNTIGLYNSICLNKPTSKYLSIAFKLNHNLFDLDIRNITLNLCLTNKNNPNQKYVFNESFRDLQEFDFIQDESLDVCISNNLIVLSLYIEDQLGDHFILQGVDKDNYLYLNIQAQEEIHVEEFLLIDYEGADSLVQNYQNLYSKPERGDYQNTSIKYNNQSLLLTCDVNNPLSIETILSSVKAYDYQDNSEVEVTYSDISYQQGIDQKKLGTYYLDLIAKDSKNNISTLKVEISLKDLYAPTINLINEGNLLRIPLSTCNEVGTQIDLNNYVIIADDYESNIHLTSDSTYFIYQDLNQKDVTLRAKDSSGNIGSKHIKVQIYDDIYPTITCQEEVISLRPYQYTSAEEIIKDYLTIEDNIKVKSTTISNDTFTSNYKKVGNYSFDVNVSDEEGNITSKTINVVVEDHQGPVFFIYDANLSLYTSDSYISAGEMYNLLIRNNQVQYKKYRVIEYANEVYNENYQKVGTYEVVLSCYDEKYQKEYIKVNLNISKDPSKVSFLTKVGKFFNDIFSWLRDFFNSAFKNISKWFTK